MSEQQWQPQYHPPQSGPGGRFYQHPQPEAQPPSDPRPHYSPPQQPFQQAAWPAPRDDAAPPPMHDAVPAGPPPPPRKRRKVPVPVIAGCALALILAGGAYAMSGGGNPTPTITNTGMTANGNLKTLWAAGGTAGAKLEDFSGSWATSSVVVDARVDGAIAYQLSNGAQAWGWQAPANTAACYMSATTSDDIGVIGYGSLTAGSVENCDHLVGIDVMTGQALWTINLDPTPSSNSFSHVMVNTPDAAIDGNILATVAEDQTMAVFDLKTGKLRWQTPDTNGSIEAAVCNPEGIQVAGQKVYELSSCLSTSAGGGQSVTLDAYPANATSAPSPTQLSGAGSLPTNTTPELWSSGDYILAVGFAMTSANEILAYDVGAGDTYPVTVNIASYNHDAFESSVNGQLNPRAWALSGDTLYMETPGSTNSIQGVAAISLKTGKQLWTQTPGGNTSSTIVDANTRGVEVIMTVPQQSGYRLATLDPSNGTATNGPGTSDNRFYINGSNSSLYIRGTYFVNIEDMTVGNTPGVVVLSGVTG